MVSLLCVTFKNQEKQVCGVCLSFGLEGSNTGREREEDPEGLEYAVF